jgi:cyclophilin family peptidyl-prolyl cis-trans isomerase
MNKGITLLLILLVVVGLGASLVAFSPRKAEVMKDESNSIAFGGSLSPTQAALSTPVAENTGIMEDTNMKKSYTAVLKTTEGDITIELAKNATPKTVNNFVTLAQKNFYDNTIFHRVLDGFMIQGGDPEGTGRGGPGYRFDDEPFQGEYSRGTIAMANAGPNTNGSQFFIMHKDYPLPKNYVIFGKVISGIEVVDAIATADVTTSESGEPSKPVNPVKIVSVEIIEQ